MSTDTAPLARLSVDPSKWDWFHRSFTYAEPYRAVFPAKPLRPFLLAVAAALHLAGFAALASMAMLAVDLVPGAPVLAGLVIVASTAALASSSSARVQGAAGGRMQPRRP